MSKSWASLFLCSMLLLVGCKDSPPDEAKNPSQGSTAPSEGSTHSVTSTFNTNDGRDEDFGFMTTQPATSVEEDGPVVIGDEPEEGIPASDLTEMPDGEMTETGDTPSGEGLSLGEGSMDLSTEGVNLGDEARSLLEESFGGNVAGGQESDDTTPSKPVIDGKLISHSEVDVKTASAEIQAWVDQKKQVMGVSSKDDKSLSYLLVSAGEKPNNGTQIVIDGVYQTSDRIKIPFSIKEPDGSTMSLQVKTFPYKLIVIPKTDLPINFERY